MSASSFHPISRPGRTSPPPVQRVCLPQQAECGNTASSVRVCVGRRLIAHGVPLKRLHLQLNLAGCVLQLSSLQCCTDLLQRRGHGTPPGGETNTLTKFSKVNYTGGLLTSTFTQVELL